jgi:hypothetical protein
MSGAQDSEKYAPCRAATGRHQRGIGGMWDVSVSQEIPLKEERKRGALIGPASKELTNYDVQKRIVQGNEMQRPGMGRIPGPITLCSMDSETCAAFPRKPR